MITIVIVLALFVVEEVLAQLLAVAIDNYEAFSQGVRPDHLTSEATTLGVCLLFTSLIFSVALAGWFFRVEPRKRQPVETGKGLLSFLTLQPLQRDIAVRSAGVGTIAMSICAILLLMLGLDSVLSPLGLSDNGVSDLFEDMTAHPLCVLTLCVAGPLTEELVFRVGVFRQLFRLGLPLWAAAVISALLFAIAHGNLQQAIPAFVAGLTLALLFWRSGDLRLCLPAHVANNTLAVVSFRLNLAEQPMPILLGLALLCTSLVLFYRILHKSA